MEFPLIIIIHTKNAIFAVPDKSNIVILAIIEKTAVFNQPSLTFTDVISDDDISLLLQRSNGSDSKSESESANGCKTVSSTDQFSLYEVFSIVTVNSHKSSIGMPCHETKCYFVSVCIHRWIDVVDANASGVFSRKTVSL